MAKPIEAMLFAQQRLLVLTLFTSTATAKNMAPAYAFAWDASVYPINHADDLHKAFADQFEVSESMLNDLIKFMADHWYAKKPLSFYDMESHYRVREQGSLWNRPRLVSAVRYLYLQGHNFDNQFWSTLLANGQCPSEAHSIPLPFLPSDVYFC